MRAAGMAYLCKYKGLFPSMGGLAAGKSFMGVLGDRADAYTWTTPNPQPL